MYNEDNNSFSIKTETDFVELMETSTDKVDKLCVFGEYTGQLPDFTKYTRLNSVHIYRNIEQGIINQLSQLKLAELSFYTDSTAIHLSIPSLESLTIRGNGDFYSPIEKMLIGSSKILIEDSDNIKELKLSYIPNLDIHDIINLHNLQKLQLNYCDIEDICGIEELKSLKWVNISGNQIVDLGSLANLNLEYVDVTYNQVSDLTPLLGIRRLQTLLAYENLIDFEVIKDSFKIKDLIISDEDKDYYSIRKSILQMGEQARGIIKAAKEYHLKNDLEGTELRSFYERHSEEELIESEVKSALKRYYERFSPSAPGRFYNNENYRNYYVTMAKKSYPEYFETTDVTAFDLK